MRTKPIAIIFAISLTVEFEILILFFYFLFFYKEKKKILEKKVV